MGHHRGDGQAAAEDAVLHPLAEARGVGKLYQQLGACAGWSFIEAEGIFGSSYLINSIFFFFFSFAHS